MINSLKTKMKISATAHDVYEAFVDPTKIRNFWFSTSSDRWETAKVVALSYPEYAAPTFDIKIVECETDKRIVFIWGEDEINLRTVTIMITNLNSTTTLVEITESGFIESEESMGLLIGSKEGWVFMLTCLKAYLENGINTLRLGLFVK